MSSIFATYRYHFLLHGVIFLWGFTGILGKIITIPSFSIVWWRMSIALVGLIIFMILTRRPFRTTTKKAMSYLIVGAITAAHWLFFFEALKVSNVSITLTTLASTALFVALVEPIFFKRRIIPYEIVLGLCTLGGLAIIFQAESDYSLGVIYALISAVLAAIFGTVNGVFVKHDRPTLITAYEMLGGVIALSIYFAVVGGFGSFEFPTQMDWVWLLILGLVCTSLAFVVSIEVLKVLSPFTASMSINMEPIYAIIFAVIIFKDDEFMSPLFYVGALVVIATIFVNGFLKMRWKNISES
ncbi:MAG: DMT family transporter [Flavobacteriales bacterium]|nr:DMT family transporter [Flavobacteriales bacterium]MBT4705132.1 DMT family transporter [Flavobacteriales bacterium]MBT4930152.1 DMT family transporter [Flavobacteriales bacterium]MBT5133110.1 DMT family transporter [Flavobacteriales bacterium]MBT6133704.1 DMT family transporter [Flavobacteriales bacterium]